MLSPSRKHATQNGQKKCEIHKNPLLRPNEHLLNSQNITPKKNHPQYITEPNRRKVHEKKGNGSIYTFIVTKSPLIPLRP